ncbi:hypothetical protein JXD20_03155 [Candidatus Peregrinibacteria bacterium]|nr:hypothetical protein [Candidatus Peregrinibacteria bacterium]
MRLRIPFIYKPKPFVTKNEIFFAAVYFVQAAVGISALAEFLFTRNELGMSFVELGILSALPTISWSIKPIYGFITDLIPIRGYRRRPYLHIMPLITMFSWLYIWQFADSFISFAIPLMIANIGLGFTDVICDGLVVQQSDKKTTGRYQSICWGSLTVGAIITTFLSGMLLGREIVDIRDMFLITALIPLITFGLSFLIKEKKITDRKEIKIHKAISPIYIVGAVIAFVATAYLISPRIGTNMAANGMYVILIWFVWFALYFRHLINLKVIGKSIFIAAIFTFLWRFTPSFGAPWSDYFINQVRIDQETYQYFGVVAYVGWLIGAIIFAKWLDKLNLKKVLFWTIVANAILTLSQLGLTQLEFANHIGNFAAIKYLGAIIASPVYLIGKGADFWTQIMSVQGIIYLEFTLEFFLGVLYMMSFLALLKFVALSTPKNLEGTNFAVFASIMNFGLVFGSISGGMIYENIQIGMLGFNGLQITVLLGSITSLAALIVLPWINVKHLAHEEHF